MKRVFCLIIVVCCIFALCACGDDKESGKTDITTPSNATKIDIDLSVMSGTVAYSQVYDMVNNSSRYEGKIVKMQGPFSAFYSSETELYYPAVIIKDATACCAQGIEFVLKGNPSYPSGYPELEKEITVIGEFEIYYEGPNKFCHLVNAMII